MNAFALHPQLAADCHDLGRLGVSRLLLMNDARYRWFILVPEIANARELHELDAPTRHRLSDDSAKLCHAMQAAFRPDKLNIATLGNVVPQLHIHHIARFRDDPAWPGPVWGHSPPRAYQPHEVAAIRHHLGDALPEIAWHAQEPG